ncbi:MAG TPA: iron-containing alcohol dehydrogenase [Firmicutes bacterium]|nr:iron-containing alcohol dehydrogenase [Bacillota bacterium]
MEKLFQQFTFSLPTRIEFGAGAIKRTASLMSETVKGTRTFVVTDPGLEKAGLVEPVVKQLSEAGYKVRVFDEVQPNPKDIDCERGGVVAREFGADHILALGGGSVIDSAKAIALLNTHEGAIAQYAGRGKVSREVTPVVAIPTTAGTGSEVTRSAVITDTVKKLKFTVKDIRLAPKLAIIDPETTYSLPESLTASTGMDALVHAIEAFTCKAATPFSDVWAKEAIRLIFSSLRAAVHRGTPAARTAMMLGSVMAGIAFSHADVAAVHCMAEALGGLYDTPHGVANSIFLPVVTQFNAEAAPSKHAEVARLCGLPVNGLSEAESARLLVSELEQLARDIGIPRFSELGYVNPADFQALAQVSFENGSTPTNCRDITCEDYLALFRKAYQSA